MCAIADVSPNENLTIKEVFILALKKQELRWDHTSSILAMIYNVVSQKPRKPSEFHPYHSQMGEVNKSRMDFTQAMDSIRKAIRG